MRLLERRSARTAAWAPRLWRPSDQAGAVLRAMAERMLTAPDTVCLGSEDAVLLGVRRDAGRVVVDHLESVSDDADELARLLTSVPAEAGEVAVFTPLADEVRLRATDAAGFVATGRWWVRDLPISLAVAGNLGAPRPGYSLAPPPPFHDPGGPIAVIGKATSAQDLVEIGVDAAAREARVAVVIAGPGSPLEALAAEAAYQPVAELRAR
ncbi:hypothetical protein GGQ22_08980 [Nocardioides sp. zg-579]|uniref:Uncharacterized protein n=1 Tax=Nocardioides marmotae TaxID=2663857 RepID=A0A6I3JAT2_9ACTN|nr:hypothetical protein [Nocardioides marmotae]MCR6031579.1 hypothetical protein [Gordonia jinghuaiqii]MTB95218.1 hypothetical protein [Nocardioides marmotae]QKE02306.1 hypothetical protein HPC71_15415 [Nocardioides marmotae]